MQRPISPIIQVSELLQLYQSDRPIIIDVSNGKNARSNYEAQHLKGARFVDLNTQLAEIKDDLCKGGRHPLPTIENFAKTLSMLGISPKSHVVIYDDKNGSNAAARFWWMLKAVGHEKVQVLNGGLQEAKKHDFPLSSKSEQNHKADAYEVVDWKLPIAKMEEVDKALHSSNYLIVDVRDADRYHGKTEPIDLIAGHIPGSTNIPFTENLDENGLFMHPKLLRNKYITAFESVKSENIIVHCGSGVTACHTLLAIAYAGLEIPKLYVGSWSEWSRNNKKMELKK